MSSIAGPRTARRLVLLLASALLAPTVILPQPAIAGPRPVSPSPANEGGTPLLRDVLEATGRGYVRANAAAAASRTRQRTLDAELRAINDRLAALAPQVAEVTAEAYRLGRIGPTTMLLNSASPDQFLARAKSLEVLARRNDARLSALHAARSRAIRAKARIDAEVAEEQRLLSVMARQKADAEQALRLVGGESTRGFVSATSPIARQSPRGSDGSWPRQSCTENDPTTTGCVTPRLLFALNEANRAGFTRFVSCFRPVGPYEHPKGRACDFSSSRRGFSGDAGGAERLYGNNLAAFFVRNADKLGVLYVIWYRQIWFPATGWRSYGGAFGDPSSDHTNHVHLSVL
ncbi:coiled-coil domain-containing protein [Plantactinospora sp. GCM10030261]|uniref:coiled-coil domain-containing protein n=1 Tax=Plantactinospora sp. GCM10030261 TaxID=3273420 RepID=UPI00360DF746